MVLGSKLTRSFFSNGKYSVSNEVLGKLFVCLSFFGLIVISWNRFFFAARIFLHVILLVLLFSSNFFKL